MLWGYVNGMREKTCCFSGHRHIDIKSAYQIKKKLKSDIIYLIENGYCYFGTGGALGFDTIAANVILSLKKKYSKIKLILVLPCETQGENWSQKDQRVYEKIKKRADKVVYISKSYFSGCMHKRNRHLIDNSSVCICYLKKNVGGTAYTVDYARKQGVYVINIADVV